MDIVSRAEAKKRGLTHYFTGKPCKYGHRGIRYAINGNCQECTTLFPRDPLRQRQAYLKHAAANPDGNRERVARWRAANPDLAVLHGKVAHARRRGRKDGAGFCASDIRFLLRAQRGRCAYCRKPLRGAYHADHIEPLARGGANSPKNIQLLCPKCNRRKYAKDPLVFARQLGLLI